MHGLTTTDAGRGRARVRRRAGVGLLVAVCSAAPATANGLHWSAPTRITAAPFHSTHSLQAMACPNSTLCVAGDDSGNVVVSTSPTGGATAWTVSEQVDPGAQITGLACPAPNLCVAVGSTGDVAVSTHPAAGAQAWKLRQGVVSPADGLRGV